MRLKSHSNRGVASIIGGVFLILIILSAYTFFVMSNKTTNDLQSTIRTMNAADGDKTQENVVINNVIHSGTMLSINISNQGPKDVDIKYISWINMDQSNSIYTFKKVDIVISPGQFLITNIEVSNPSGKYQIKAISIDGNVFTATYPFVSQSSTSVSLIQTNGPQGESVTISGSGFTSNSPISIEYDQQPVTPSNPNLATDSSGLFTTTFIIPPSHPGAHNIKTTDGNLFFASATYTRIPTTLTLSPISGQLGTVVHISGSGYLPNSVVTLTMDGTWGTVQTDSNGSIVSGSTLTVNCNCTGLETVTATDNGQNIGSTTFTVS